MDRPIVYSNELLRSPDFLLACRNAMISDGCVTQGILGTSTLFSGLGCTPTSPAGMTVNVAPGFVYSQQNVDNSAFGVLSSDTTEQIMKIGISLDTLNLSCPAPATSGQSVVYLVEAAFVEEDTGSTVLPYYNAANPAEPWAGPNNTGVSQNTLRQNICNVQLKVGTPATTGSQTTPAPDAGYTGLWAVTVANGQTTIMSGNIAQIGGAPFISETLGQKISQATADGRYAQITAVQKGSFNFANDIGTVNTLYANLSPAPSAYFKGMLVVISVAHTNTGYSVINLNGLGNTGIYYKGSPLMGGEMVAGQNVILTYDGTYFELNSVAATAVTQVFIGGTSTGSANAQAVATEQGTFTNTAGNVGTFKAGYSNTAAMTLAYDGQTALSVKKRGTSGLVDPSANDIVVGEEYMTICDGTYHQIVSPAGRIAPINSISTQIFGSSGTYTPSTGMVFCIAECIGGGGGGGGAKCASTAQVAAGSGGGEGGYAKKLITAATIGGSQAVTIGAGGNAGSNTGGTGTSGGTSSLGSIISATGGNAGVGSASSTNYVAVGGTAGGAGIGGDLNVTGETSLTGTGLFISGVQGYAYGGNGAGDGGGLGGATTGGAQNGTAAAGYGGGGGGAGCLNTTTGATGGAGSSGVVIITEFCSN